VNSSHAFCHSRMIAGCFLAQASLNWEEPLFGGPDGRRRVDGPQPLGELVPVFAGRVLEAVPEKVDHTRLHLGVLPEAC
jgi:hypothetical protein